MRSPAGTPSVNHFFQVTVLLPGLSLQVKCVVGKKSHNWNPSVTHVVAPGLKRNQKCMAGLAAGLWLVGREYVAACSATGDMVAPVSSDGSAGGGVA